MASKVYFTDFHTTSSNNIFKKLKNLLVKAGMDKIDFDGKFTAIKIHFGEPGNISFIRPEFAAAIVKFIKERGGIPFLTDTNTLYTGSRSDVVRHLETAFKHGFNPLSAGCQVIIADGLKGTDYQEIEINQKYTQKAKIGSVIADADIVISMNHFKGHELTGFGGCLKNLGMGSGSVGGKLFMHSGDKPIIVKDACTACKMCEKNCAYDAVHVVDKVAVIDYEKCVGCGQCVAVCQYNSAMPQWDSKRTLETVAEYASAAIKDKPHFHVNFLMNISPNCDCWPNNDVAITPDIGICASYDPVAIDKASVDLVNKAPVNKGSVICEHDHSHNDKFKMVFPATDWQKCLNHAEEIGIGSQDYELEEVN